MGIDALLQKERGYLIGFFLGDGYMNYNKKDRHYRVEFLFNSIRDIEIMNYIEDLLRKSELNPFFVRDKRYNSVSMRVNSKKLMEEIKRLISKINACGK